MSDVKVKITSQADTSGVRSMASAMDAMIGRSLGLNGALQGLRTQLAGLVVGGAVVMQIRAAVSAAQEAAVATAQLGQALVSTRQWSVAAMSALEDQASMLERFTGVQDETVMSVQRLLLSFGATVVQAERMTPAVLDMAAAMGMDAVSAARLLGRALDGQAEGLSRYNITARSIPELIEQVSRAFGGQASMLQRAKGPLGEVTVLYDNLQEELGRGLMQTLAPGFRAMAESLRTLLGVFSSDAFRSGLQRLSSLLTSGIISGAILGLSTALGGAVRNLAAFVGLWRQFGALPAMSAVFTASQVAVLGLTAKLAVLVTTVEALKESWLALSAVQDQALARQRAEETLLATRRRLEAEIASRPIPNERAAELQAILERGFAGKQVAQYRYVSAGIGGVSAVPDGSRTVRDLDAELEAIKKVGAALRDIHGAQTQSSMAKFGEAIRTHLTQSWKSADEAVRSFGQSVTREIERQKATAEYYRSASAQAQQMEDSAAAADVEREKQRSAALSEYRRGIESILEAEEQRDQASQRQAAARKFLGQFGGQLGLQAGTMFEQLGAAASNAAAIVTTTLGTAFRSISSQITELIMGTVTWGQALANIGRSILTQLVSSMVNFFVALGARALLAALFGTMITKAAAAAAASAWAGPAILASIASYGAASGIGTASAMTATLAGAPLLATAAIGAGGFAEGGLVGGGERLIRVNERGPEFVVNASATAAHRPLLESLNRGGSAAVTSPTESSPMRIVIVDNRRDAEELARDPRWRSALIDLASRI